MQHSREERHPHVTAIVDKIKSEGIFDALRRDCLADVDLKVYFSSNSLISRFPGSILLWLTVTILARGRTTPFI